MPVCRPGRDRPLIGSQVICSRASSMTRDPQLRHVRPSFAKGVGCSEGPSQFLGRPFDEVPTIQLCNTGLQCSTQRVYSLLSLTKNGKRVAQDLGCVGVPAASQLLINKLPEVFGKFDRRRLG